MKRKASRFLSALPEFEKIDLRKKQRCGVCRIAITSGNFASSSQSWGEGGFKPAVFYCKNCYLKPEAFNGITELGGDMANQSKQPATGWEKEFEDLWSHWVYLSDIKTGVNFNVFKNGIKNVFCDFLSRREQEVRKEALKEAIQLSDVIEEEDDTTLEEWRAFKRFRNTLRERLGQTIEAVKKGGRRITSFLARGRRGGATAPIQEIK